MSQLTLSISQHTSPGRKEINQDFHDIRIPPMPILETKGAAVAIADGISSSKVSQEASKVAVSSFLEDYFSTSEAWSVKKSAQRVIYAVNSWIYAQNRQNLYHLDKDRGYVCTFSALIFKADRAYFFHVGDIRIYRLREGKLQQLTEDHRVWISSEKSYLARAIGIDTDVKIDYESLEIEAGDIFLLMSDGVYEFVSDQEMIDTVHGEGAFEKKAESILNKAMEQGSDDNLTIQIVRVDSLPEKADNLLHPEIAAKAMPPLLQARMEFDGYTIERQLYCSSRSHVYLAKDNETGEAAVIKVPSTEHKEDQAYMERFLLEEWIARRINNEHVLKAYLPNRDRNYLYTVMEYIEGQTLEQWMRDHPKPGLEEVRQIAEQLARGVLAFHRQEMIHQDLRPANIMIDKNGTVKLIDLGSVRVAGITEINTLLDQEHLLGTATYAAPEYFTGDVGSDKSDLFSLGVIIYQMLSGELPYGTDVAKIGSKSEQKRLKYRTLYRENSDLPQWVDETLRKALHPDPFKRYRELSEFTYDLRHPNPKYLRKGEPPLMERNPELFWKYVALVEAVLIVIITTLSR